MSVDNAPLVSVVVTTYNRKNLLKETLSSILNQTYSNFELIVVDNFSNYNFFKHINSFNDNRIKAYQNKNNDIIATNRNVGIKNAKGDLIAFCDDDDLWEPNKLEIQMKYLQDSNLIGVGSTMKIIGTTIIRPVIKKNKQLTLLDLYKSNKVALSSLIVENTGLLFCEDERYKTCEDWYFQIELLQKCGRKFLLLKQPLIHYRKHSLNISKEKSFLDNKLNVITHFKMDMPSEIYPNALFKAYIHNIITSLRLGKSTKKYLKVASSLTLSFKQKLIVFIFKFIAILPSKFIKHIVAYPYNTNIFNKFLN